jgi:hypothetical protein
MEGIILLFDHTVNSWGYMASMEHGWNNISTAQPNRMLKHLSNYHYVCMECSGDEPLSAPWKLTHSVWSGLTVNCYSIIEQVDVRLREGKNTNSGKAAESFYANSSEVPGQATNLHRLTTSRFSAVSPCHTTKPFSCSVFMFNLWANSNFICLLHLKRRRKIIIKSAITSVNPRGQFVVPEKGLFLTEKWL